MNAELYVYMCFVVEVFACIHLFLLLKTVQIPNTVVVLFQCSNNPLERIHFFSWYTN